MDWTIKGDGEWKVGAVMELRTDEFVLTAEHKGATVACELRQLAGFPNEESQPQAAFDVAVYDDPSLQRLVFNFLHGNKIGEIICALQSMQASPSGTRLQDEQGGPALGCDGAVDSRSAD